MNRLIPNLRLYNRLLRRGQERKMVLTIGSCAVCGRLVSMQHGFFNQPG